MTAFAPEDCRQQVLDRLEACFQVRHEPICQLPGDADEPGPILAVEYKGADRWAAAEDDRLIGGLWANLSEGRCRFVMVREKQWERIEEQLRPSGAVSD